MVFAEEKSDFKLSGFILKNIKINTEHLCAIQSTLRKDVLNPGVAVIESIFFPFVLSVVLIGALRPLASHLGLVDAPCIRKRHEGVVPLIGGLAVYSALLLLSFHAAFWQANHGAWLIALGLPLLLMGMADDRWDLSAKHRLMLELVCAVFAVWYCGVRISDIGVLVPGIGGTLVWLAVPLTVVGIVGGINAMNMTDGVDGLAGGLAVLTLSALAVAAYPMHSNVALQLASMVAALVGFLVFNSRFFGRKRAAVFMGDGGSIFIGFAIVWYLVTLSQGAGRVITPVSALWLFAVPLLDTVTIMFRRIARGNSPFAADREHLHHILMLAGFGVNRAVLIILSIHGLCILIGMGSIYYQIPDWVMFWLFLGLFGVYYGVMTHAWRWMKRIKSFREWAGFEDRRREATGEAGRSPRSGRRQASAQFQGNNRRKRTSRRTEQ
ncbi:hypothetical protein [Rhodoferax sp.]|uniref:hypothetical protein n=1 Tax=Rhodoferax sp. TaxID=50421 RepID=UPI00262744AA|nr:hypothetical protein [Rhodoferax sp.]MDD5480378.1 hypothetical protein [Rhodoferax sp.]